MKERLDRIFDEQARLLQEFRKQQSQTILKLAEVFLETLQRGRTIFLFGNGGSAADSQHIAAEYVNRFRTDRRALPALALTTDTSVLTSIANDSGYEKVFARQLEAFGRPDDLAVAISTSGGSPNVIEGVRTARRLGLATVGFAGGEGGALARETEHCLTVPSKVTARVQEMHILAGHAICDLVEQELVHRSRDTK